jgi:hypothetical protein
LASSHGYLQPPSHRWPQALNLGGVTDGPGVIGILLPRGTVAIWEGHSWRKVMARDWNKTFIEPFNHRLAPFAVIKFDRLTECCGNARTVQYQCSEGLAQQLLIAPWHASLARILEWLLESEGVAW